MGSAAVALENLLDSILIAAQEARAEGDESALLAYFNALDIGLAEAKDNGVVFASNALLALDPYDLLKPVERVKAHAPLKGDADRLAE